MKKKSVPLNLHDVKDALRHLNYEADMFITVPKAPVAKEIPICLNMICESFAVHLRNMAHFFLLADTPIRDDDITIKDFEPYLIDWTPPSIKEKDRDFLKLELRRAHKQVAHLTKQRLNSQNPSWPWFFDKSINIIAPYWHSFVDSLNEDLTIQLEGLKRESKISEVIIKMSVHAPTTLTKVVWPPKKVK